MKSHTFKAIALASFLSTGVMQTQAEVGSGNASNLSYNYAGIRYLTQDLDDLNCDQDGFNLYGSLDIQSGLYAEASFTDVSGNNNCGSNSYAANLGYHIPYNKAFDFFVALGAENVSPDVGDSDSGIFASVGFRGFLRKQLETKVELFSRTTFDNDTGINGSAVYWFAPQIGATVDLGVSSDTTTAAVGARLYF